MVLSLLESKLPSNEDENHSILHNQALIRLAAENYFLMLQLPITYDGPITLIEMLSYERILKILEGNPFRDCLC